MGFNTVAVFLNDHSDKWPNGMVTAMNQVSYTDANPRLGHFPGGQVVSSAHADDIQLVAVNRNCGHALNEFDQIDQTHLDKMEDVLRAHGYGVRPPNQTKVKEPTTWGYHGKQLETANAAKPQSK